MKQAAIGGSAMHPLDASARQPECLSVHRFIKVKGTIFSYDKEVEGNCHTELSILAPSNRFRCSCRSLPIVAIAVLN